MSDASAGPYPGPDGMVADQIRVTGLTATGHHGVLAHERRDGQTFVADVVMHVDTRPAAAGDDLAETTSYAEVAEEVVAVLEGSPSDLIETVAERVAATVLAHPGVLAVDTTIHKPQAPIAVPFDDAVVSVRRDRVHRPPVVPPAPPLGAPPAAAADDDAADRSEHAVPTALSVPPVPTAPSVPVEPLAEAAPAVDAAPSLDGTGDGPDGAGPDGAEQSAAPEDHEPDRMDQIPAGPVDVVLALGANLGDPRATLRAAVLDVDRISGLELTEVAPLARTAAVGPEQPDYLNTVVLGRTTLSARDLLHACQEVELKHGRERHERWGPRTLDVDIVTYGTLVGSADDLEIPHPRAHERAFVLEPWAQVDPDAVLPGLGGGGVAALAATAPDRPGVRWLALDWLTEPEPGPAVVAPVTGGHRTAPEVDAQVPVVGTEDARGSGDTPRPADDAEAVEGRGTASVEHPAPVAAGAPGAPAAPAVQQAPVVPPAPPVQDGPASERPSPWMPPSEG
ncbi:2-amino-4-hydroxy-6-hydroxymethyldihydropteridine diphosphokinase [Cellulomonas sp. PhB143]|uniref:2-amino-4-hydroxy-6- hydroxymethyldihydropteridine diphosphokinase n=1 Tax=Cellulomonas sp. PhB143 TaxID=2485186 RepID=UPI000FAD8179|nr:2-amino-4-hydroxy-6-hydroxymethyldihydropteridine diphosphokinase [Cellulomonas sp. PhB143]ROS78823.1 dihydroneopterin aldolase/2-amino-4-hydroxy-6-hydroxymethyldihydropteridine diphosphokinase [Cellulomonas sp. PhB143]